VFQESSKLSITKQKFWNAAFHHDDDLHH